MAKRIYNRWRGYSVKDCDCKYCLHFGGSYRGKVKCLTEECVCKEELRQAIARERRME